MFFIKRRTKRWKNVSYKVEAAIWFSKKNMWRLKFFRLVNEKVRVLVVSTFWSSSFAVPMWLIYMVLWIVVGASLSTRVFMGSGGCLSGIQKPWLQVACFAYLIPCRIAKPWSLAIRNRLSEICTNRCCGGWSWTTF